MFSRFANGLRQRDTRSVGDLFDIIRKSYTPVPHLEMVEDTMNFDAHKNTIGYGLLAGIQGEQDAHQEEKPHQIKVVRVEGRATLFWRALAKNQRKKSIKGQQAELNTLEIIKGSVLQRHAGDPDIDTVRDSCMG